ncbi:MAG: HD domain-containing protein [Planctomycetaceae bacterium]|nr:HD domain-containing protein [Planctomycetaceae bacterium]
METEKLRRKIAFTAAQLLCSRRENSFVRARWRAVRSITRCYVPPDGIPTDMEIRAELQQLVTGGIGSVPPAAVNNAVRTDLTDLEFAGDELIQQRYEFFRSLLLPLDRVRQDRMDHPEGDVLYHSLQVFELMRSQQPLDSDALLAALLHDIGKGIDPWDHVKAGLRILQGRTPERTEWLITHLATAHELLDGTIGHRARKRLRDSHDEEVLILLARCDREGRTPGRRVCSVEDALTYALTCEEDLD